MNATNAVSMENAMELNSEFQLVELEQRLEMAAGEPVYYCCFCIMNCEMVAM